MMCKRPEGEGTKGDGYLLLIQVVVAAAASLVGSRVGVGAVCM